MTRLTTCMCATICMCVTIAFAIGLTALASDPAKKSKQGTTTQLQDTDKASTKVADAEKKDDKTGRGDRWMGLKLASSQFIFAELTRGNLEGVAQQARASQVVDALEYWLRGHTFRQQSEYQKQLNRYQFATRELARHADDGNIDGALESWLDVNRSCIECHKLLRDNGQMTPAKERKNRPEALPDHDNAAVQKP